MLQVQLPTTGKSCQVVNIGVSEVFDGLKSDLANATKLHVIQFGEPCGILVDASNISVGCCLIQWAQDGLEKPIAFASAKLTPTQTCWSTIEREAYAVMFALRKCSQLRFWY